MFNDVNLGPITIHMYGFMIAIGFITAYLVSEYRAKKRGMNSDALLGILWCAVIGGMLGAKVLFYVVSIKDIMKDISILWDFKNGYVVYGGIIGGVLASYIYLRIKGERFIEYLDLVLPSVALAQGFGRLGCFFAGCCYGRETDLPIGIVFKHSDYAPNGVSLMPTQLISSAGDFLIAISLYMYAKKKRPDGRVAGFYLILYSVGRFGVEFLRNDYRGSIGILSTSQIISIVILLLGILVTALSFKKEKTTQNDI